MNRPYNVIQPRRLLYGLLAVLSSSLLCAANANADNTTTVNIFGSVFSGPVCTITGNSGSNIEVSFGTTLMINMINGVNYKQPIPFSLNCTGNPSTLKFKFGGNPGASFDTTVLATNLTDLGVRLLKPDGSDLNLNEVFEVTVIGAPNFMAVPVQRAGAVLPTGTFGASATLTVEVL